MADFNVFNHNKTGNPHPQYDVTSFDYKYISADILKNSGFNYAYVKLGSLVASTDMLKLPTNMRSNVLLNGTIEFELKDTQTEGPVFTSDVSITIKAKTSNSNTPNIRIEHKLPTGLTDKALNERKILIKQTAYPQYLSEDKQIPVVLDVYASTTIYGQLALLPKRFDVHEHTWNNLAPFGNITSSNSTMVQKFSSFVGNNNSGEPILESDILSLSDNQTIIYPITSLPNPKIQLVDDGFDFNSLDHYSGNIVYISSNWKNCLNAPWDKTNSYYVEHKTIVEGWSVEMAHDYQGNEKKRIFAINQWSDWK